MPKEERTIKLSKVEQSLLLRAVGDYIKTVSNLVGKIKDKGYEDSAKNVSASIGILKDLETKLL